MRGSSKEYKIIINKNTNKSILWNGEESFQLNGDKICFKKNNNLE